MSDSVRPHRQQPTRLPCHWDSSDKNTGVGCHFLLQCMKVKSEREVAQSCPSLRDPMDCRGSPTRLLHPWDFPGKGIGVGCHCLLHCVLFLQTFGYLILIKNLQDVYCHHFYTYFTYPEEKNREIKDPAKIKQQIKCKVKIRSDCTYTLFPPNSYTHSIL